MPAIFDPLECRRLMSAGLKSGVLRVTSTDADDVINFDLVDGRIVVTTNGVREGTFNRTAVKKIIVDARDGDDYVAITSSIKINAVMHGGEGEDVLVGGSGHDTLLGQDGKDLLRGRKGNDRIDPGGGDNTMDGGAGTDTADFSSLSTGLFMGGIRGVATSSSDGKKVATYSSFEMYEGTAEDDVMFGAPETIEVRGNGGNDRLSALGARATLLGGDGNDTLSNRRGANVFDGGSGRDRVDYHDSYLDGDPGVVVSLDGVANDGRPGENDDLRNIEDITGTRAADTLIGNNQSNVLNGGIGNDTLRGEGGNDTLHGGYGADSLEGGEGTDVLNGSSENDTLIGNAGRDVLYGEDGDDRFYARDFERDQINGGAGNDRALIDPNSGNIFDIKKTGDGYENIEFATEDRFLL
jgi:Ca2+-binding RTX toxin-like protein